VFFCFINVLFFLLKSVLWFYAVPVATIALNYTMTTVAALLPQRRVKMRKASADHPPMPTLTSDFGELLIRYSKCVSLVQRRCIKTNPGAPGVRIAGGGRLGRSRGWTSPSGDCMHPLGLTTRRHNRRCRAPAVYIQRSIERPAGRTDGRASCGEYADSVNTPAAFAETERQLRRQTLLQPPTDVAIVRAALNINYDSVQFESLP